jgi:hypothetical protein
VQVKAIDGLTLDKATVQNDKVAGWTVDVRPRSPLVVFLLTLSVPLVGFSCVQHTSSGRSGLDIWSMPSKQANQSGPHAEPCRNATPPCMRMRIHTPRSDGTTERTMRRRPGPTRAHRPNVRGVLSVLYSTLQYSTVLYSTLQYSVPTRAHRPNGRGVLSVLADRPGTSACNGASAVL